MGIVHAAMGWDNATDESCSLKFISTNARTDKRNRLKNTCFFLSFIKRLVSISNILKQFLSFLQKEGLNIHVTTTAKSIIVG